MNTIDIGAITLILLFSGAGFFLGGITILVESLQFITTLLLTISLKSLFIKLFSSFMTSPLLTEISSLLVSFATFYLILSIGVSFIYRFFEPFKVLLLNKICGLICGAIIGFLTVYTATNFLSTNPYFKNIIDGSYLYKISK